LHKRAFLIWKNIGIILKTQLLQNKIQFSALLSWASNFSKSEDPNFLVDCTIKYVLFFGLNICTKTSSFRQRIIFRPRPKIIFCPLCCFKQRIMFNNRQQLSTTPWQHSGLLRKFLTARFFSKLLWIKTLTKELKFLFYCNRLKNNYDTWMKTIFGIHCCCRTRFGLIQQFPTNRPKYCFFVFVRVT
jgi:hypothetical protein